MSTQSPEKLAYAPTASQSTGYFSHELVKESWGLVDGPENALRLTTLEERLFMLGLAPYVWRSQVLPVNPKYLRLAHDEDYLQYLEATSRGEVCENQDFFHADTPITEVTYQVAYMSASTVLRAIDAVSSGVIQNAFCAIRPPGHHAGRRQARGFCFLNNVALGALYAREVLGFERVLVLDFDVHHGDGTEEILANQSGIQFLSLFQDGIYPHRQMDPTPDNVMLNTLPVGATGDDLMRVLDESWIPAIKAFKPDLMIWSSGFDAHQEETIAQLKLTDTDYAVLTRRCLEAALPSSTRVVSVLEGGYNVRSLARSALVHLETLIRFGQAQKQANTVSVALTPEREPAMLDHETTNL